MKKRTDGRTPDQMRPIKAEVGVIPNADGSAMFQMGNTIAYAAVYGPREMYPRFLQNPKCGVLRCSYNMMPFSGHGERVRPGGSRRSREISVVTENALRPVLDLSDYPNAVVDVFIELTQTDAGTRCAGITAAAMALADAGFKMKDLVASMSMGFLDGEIITDVNGTEDCVLGATDVPIALIPGIDKISLLQLDGEIPRETLKKLLETGKARCLEIYKAQQEALKKKYKVD